MTTFDSAGPLTGGSYLASLVITTKLFADFSTTPPSEDWPTSPTAFGSMEKDHPQSIQKDGEGERNYGAFQNEVYKRGTFENM